MIFCTQESNRKQISYVQMFSIIIISNLQFELIYRLVWYVFTTQPFHQLIRSSVVSTDVESSRVSPNSDAQNMRTILNEVVGDWSPFGVFSSGGVGVSGSSRGTLFLAKVSFRGRATDPIELSAANEGNGPNEGNGGLTDEQTGAECGARAFSSDKLLKTLSRINCFSYSRSCPKKLKFGDIVALFDLTYLRKNSNKLLLTLYWVGLWL